MIAIGVATRRSGVSIETFRYYERARVVPAPGRAMNGRRVFTEAEDGRLKFIRRCRDLGFAMADAKNLLDLSEGSDQECAVVQILCETHLVGIQKKISDLKRLERALKELTANCRTGSASCPTQELLKS